MNITELLEKAGTKVTCGCTEDTCSHCAGKHTLAEVGKKCSCCGNEIKEVKVDEGKSPHKKGTKKYKKHMAAMHAGMGESATGMGTGSITTAPVAVGGMQKRNPDGTAKNALDMDINVMGSKKKAKRRSKA